MNTAKFSMKFLNQPHTTIDDAWILAQRGPKNSVDPTRPYAFLDERERALDGRIVDVATLFLTNRECPFRCLMCDLWKNTTDVSVAPGAIPGQIEWALERLPSADHIKLYNSGNFFDTNAIPPADYPAIAGLVENYDTTVVECHPKLVGKRCFEFRELLPANLHIAMGLETANTAVLEALNKRMTLDDFEQAVSALRSHGMEVRTFILLRPPFLTEEEGVFWAKRSIDFAFDVGVECCAVIPTRAGNGAMDILAKHDEFEPPIIRSLETVHEYGIRKQSGRVFVDLWDAQKLYGHEIDVDLRIDRLSRMNLSQSVEPPIRTSDETGRV